MAFAILDKPIAAIRAALPRFSVGELEALRQAEEAGKTRKGAIEAIEKAIADADPPEPARDPCEITPAIVGMTIRTHDGRKVKYGETALTSPEHAAHLRELGLSL